MMDNINNDIQYDIVSSVLHEFDIDLMSSPKEVIATATVEIMLFGVLKASINKMLKTSKTDRKLSNQISNIVDTKLEVRVLSDNRIFSLNADDVIWVSSGLVKLLTPNEMISVLLHEIGHAEEKMKILYDRLIRHPRNPKRMKYTFQVLAWLIRSRGIVSDPSMMTRVYLLTFIVYTSLVDYPFKGLYKWNYSDLAVKHGYWDEYESALAKINRYIANQKPSKIVKKLENAESKNPGAINFIKRELYKSANNDDSNPINQIKKLSQNQKNKPSSSFIRKFIRSIF